MALRDWLRLSLTTGLGPILIKRLVEWTGSAETACAAPVATLQQIEGIGTTKARAIHDSLVTTGELADEELAKAAAAGATIICFDDAAYPVALKSIPDPPPVLYLKGSFEDRDLNALAIVGSRRCSHYGREQAERFGALLAGAGFTVISGGARGIDSAAHHGALQHPHGRTIAVLGCGIDVTYPPENGPLFGRIAARGALVSEFPMGDDPAAEHFPRRNRIISGLSRGVLVVEADERSGALITARNAADDHNRPVFAIPGRVDNQLSAGPHKLIRDGAVLTTNLEDIFAELGPVPHEATEPTLFPVASLGEAGSEAKPGSATQATVGLTERQKLILSHMSIDPTGVDELIERTGFPAPVILQELTFLSLRGLAKRTDGQSYALARRREMP